MSVEAILNKQWNIILSSHAIKIQKVIRGYLFRKNHPKILRKIRNARNKVLQNIVIYVI